MLVIVSICRLDNDRVEIAVTRPQHDFNRVFPYRSEKETREALLTLGISTETIDSHLKLLTQMGLNEQLKFPPMDVPQHSLRSLEFRL